MLERIRRRLADPNGPGVGDYVIMALLLFGVVALALVFFGPQTERVLVTVGEYT